MVRIKNLDPVSFRSYIETKNVYVFGAGKLLESCLELYFGSKEIAGIIDNNCKVWGNNVLHCGKQIQIMGVDSFLKEISDNRNDHVAIFITSSFYAADIVEQLDTFDELDGMEVFLQIAIRRTTGEHEDFSFTKGKEKIPKIIHYIWIGGKELPEEYKKNIETWRFYNPDYEIKEWNEKNYNFNKCRYMQEAYLNQRWGFATNCARLDIIYENGGIYLDTDVEVVASFDCLLNDKSFFNMGYADRANIGCGFGAEKGARIVKEMRDAFFSEGGDSKNKLIIGKPCHQFIHPILTNFGFDIENRYQNIDGNVLYPLEVMSPLLIENNKRNITAKTLSIHNESGTWKSEKEKESYKKTWEMINSRIV